MSDSTTAAPAAPAAPATTTSSTPAPAAKSAAPKVEVKPTLSPTKNLGDVTKSVGGAKPDAEPTEAPAQETAAERKARKLKLKVDGVEEEVDLDAMSDEDIITEMQLSRAARKRMQEAANVKKSFSELQRLMKENPALGFKELAGREFKEAAEEYLREEYRKEELPEHERKQMELEQELAKERSFREQIETQRKQAAQEAMDNTVREQITNDFHEALEESGLPKSHHTLHLMAEIARFNLDHGIELTPKQMAAEVKKRLSGVNQSVFRSLKGAALESYLGPDVVKEIIRMSVEKVRRPKQAAKSFEPPAPQTGAYDGDILEENKPARRMASMRELKKLVRGH